jgi:predicted kinase
LTVDGWCDEHRDQPSLAKPAGLRKFGGGLTLVCGPPASGKTTYCADHAEENDEVVDLDEIGSEISGRPIHKAPHALLESALRERNRRLVYLAGKAAGRTWFIVGAPTARERQWWADRLGADSVIVLETAKAECLRRCDADAERAKLDKNYPHIIGLWWKKYTKRRGDVVIEA